MGQGPRTARSGRRVGATTMSFVRGAATPAAIPADEVQRLADLHELDVLDTEPEDRITRLAELAARALDAPIATVALVDRDRVWLKACVGVSARERRRDVSLAAHVILSAAPLVVEDLAADDRFVGHPLVTAPPGLRAFVGVPLRGPRGRHVGALWVADTRARDLDARHAEVLARIGACLEDELQRRRSTEELREKAEESAYYDTLTGLPSRRLYEDRAAQAIQWASGLGQRLAVVRLDIDRFGALNKAEGHDACDGVLCETGQRLRDAIGRSGTVARWHDDEFAVLVPAVELKSDLDALVAKVREIFTIPFMINERSHLLSASIGAGVYPDDGRSAAKLLDNAGSALRTARQGSGGRARVFTAQINAQESRRFDIERRLRWAISKEQLHLVYQPKVDAHTRQIAGSEALLRWTEPDLGPISPAEFIPVAEDSALIMEIGEWVLRAACRQARSWLDAGLRPVPVAVNLATQQLLDPCFEDRVDEILAEAGLDPHLLNLEVTEGALIRDTDKSIDKMHALSQKGVKFSIDDFGTGYSSLSYLRKLPIDVLKVDRAFVMEMVTNPHDAAIVHAIIAMGQSLKLRTVAEGVETPEQALFLRAYRCDEIQGYLYSRPVLAEQFGDLLRADVPLG